MCPVLSPSSSTFIFQFLGLSESRKGKTGNFPFPITTIGWAGSGKTRNPDLNLGLPQRWQGPSYLGHLLPGVPIGRKRSQGPETCTLNSLPPTFISEPTLGALMPLTPSPAQREDGKKPALPLASSTSPTRGCLLNQSKPSSVCQTWGGARGQTVD